MSLYNGDKLKIEIYGQSHAEKIGVRVSGFPRMKIDEERLSELMQRRSPSGAVYSTKRKEPDQPIFEKGVDNGVIDGDFEAVIYNRDVKSGDYNELYARPRPSHADLVRYFKSGEKDYRGGGEFSGRLTAPMCIVGALCKQYLYEKFGVEILAYVESVGKIAGVSYRDSILTADQIKDCHGGFPSLSDCRAMIQEIENATGDGDSVGATVDCVVFNFPEGIGGSLFDGLEGKIAQLVYAIPAVKGVEFGLGFGLSTSTGYEVNDFISMVDGKPTVMTNYAGGINGGISNGNQITLSVAFRPTPSISKKQRTVDLEKMQDVEIEIKGRHDPCVGVRAVPVVESAVAIALLDSILKENRV